MEDESQRMMALKKVYAEIIMNTSKEAAERIIDSQRKAHQYRHDLDSTKEEAIRLLIRLKQSMDFKINEVEVRSQDQQRKIDELEAQLQEAEDIVGNLRAELNLAHVKLDKLSNKQIRASSNVMVNVVDDNESSTPVIRESVSASHAAETLNNGAHGHLINGSLEECGCSGEPEVPSIIIRRKETELYRNGCTQRIRACDGNLLKGHCSPAGGSDRHKNVKEGSDDKECERKSVKSPKVADTMCVEEEKPSDIKDVEDEDTLDLMRYLKILRTRRRASVYQRNTTSSFEHVPHVDKEACGNLTTLRAHLPGSRDIHESYTDLNVMRSNSPSAAPSEFSEMGALPNAFNFQSNNKLTKVCADGMNEVLEVASRNSLGTLDSTTELEMKNSSSLNLEVKLLDTCDGLSGPQKDRILKYTFQRKRKRDSITDDDCD
ncbi:hypothetical protein vseg_003097 [Gypsophila vaccaria]